MIVLVLVFAALWVSTLGVAVIQTRSNNLLKEQLRIATVARHEIEQPKTVCGCQHSYALHGDGECHATTTERVLVERGNPRTVEVGTYGSMKVVYDHERWEVMTTQCPCKQYVGPEPLPTYVNP